MSEKKKRSLMLINVTHAEESRVAIVTEGVLETFEIETFDHRSTKGNIYKGKIETVHTGLQACFVDIGDDRAGFLPLDEVNFKIHPPRGDQARGRIEHHLQRNQELLVQVVRDAYGSKPPTLSTYFSLPGRYLVLTPHDSSAGISRKLDDKQREKLRKTLESLPTPEGFGLIVRTAGAAATKAELQRDLKYLTRLWEKIEAAAQLRAPKLIYQERSLVIRAIRDLYTPEIDEILVDDEETWREIQQFFEIVLPHKKKTVHFYQGERPLFNKHNLEEQIEYIFRRSVPLKSGGALVFDTTEALTSVDVNSGRMRHEGHIEDTALKANLEAAAEIGRQLRLRDLGGLVVIDFIDMRQSKNVRQVEKAMKEALKKDKARYDITRISRLGLMEISRQRLNPNKTSLRYTDCPTCEGTGSIKTVEAAALGVLRRLQTRVVKGDLERIELVVPQEVAEYLLNAKRRELARWEERFETRIVVHARAGMKRDDMEVLTEERSRSSEHRPVVAAPVHSEIMAAIEEEQDGAEAAASEGGGDAQDGVETPKKKRRRRRRRKKKTGAAADAAEGSAGDEGASAQKPDEAVAAEEAEAVDAGDADTADAETPKKKRRRRRRRKKNDGNGAEPGGAVDEPPSPAAGGQEAPLAALPALGADTEEGPHPRPLWWVRAVGEAEPAAAE
ncbi:MAG: Rne/Rng family ribonuclease [Acidobacteriota bacterium]|nr:Rne/Rng family ribonuclease [Acidobacteriota bacterium]MDQ7086943.1 Rne/Rng family ribonuclease [Acidobacteriota bacterium]